MSEEKVPDAKPVVKQFTDAVKERLESPVFGAYAIFWLIVNWKFVALLCFWNIEMPLRILYLGHSMNAKMFWMPFLCAVLYHLLSPLCMNVVRIYGDFTRVLEAKANSRNENALHTVLLSREREKRRTWLWDQPSSTQEFVEALETQQDLLIRRENAVALNTEELETKRQVLEQERVKLRQQYLTVKNATTEHHKAILNQLEMLLREPVKFKEFYTELSWDKKELDARLLQVAAVLKKHGPVQ